ncbi:tripartite tricarboxylate transporter permease [Kiloniella majae]|uniref:tripartite tricarboxylate transporter permease n=1 Tax=Kiloniella majae TaxID=1938558 RepID=UPI000A279914|nr:tripartite tricarboxylate transporter permease [Kiloniella majae]
MWDIILQASNDILFDPNTLLLMGIGVIAGLLTGAIPGFTIAMGVVLTLPFTFGMSATQGVATMIGVFVGGLSGGLMSGMLTGIPGTPSSVATTFDGFPMARNGKPGLALGLGVWSSFFGGIISAILLVALAPQLAVLGLEFGPWDYFSLILFSLTITASLSGKALLKGMIAGILGLFFATAGEDPINGMARFDFGWDPLLQGFAFLPVLIGLFAFSQLLSDIEDSKQARRPLLEKSMSAARIEHRQAIKMIFARWGNLIRSSLIGVFTGVLPAAGSSISNILAYDQAKKAAPDDNTFGSGDPDGIIAPEAANNATAGGSLITMMALGIPGDVVTAVMIGALMIHDIVPGPSFISDQPVLAYSVFIAFFLAHFMMVGTQALTLRLFLFATRSPMYILAAIILAYCSIGVFSLHNVQFDMWVMLGFGVVGYTLRKLGFPLAPMILGVVLGQIAELNLSRALSISDDMTLFLSRPWSLFFLILAIFSFSFPWYQEAIKLKRQWASYFIPFAMAGLALPLFLMQGSIRPILAVGLVLGALFIFWKAWKKNKLEKIRSKKDKNLNEKKT